MLIWIIARLEAAAADRRGRRNMRAALALEPWLLRDLGLTHDDIVASR
jgi:hypothetical protein